MGRIDNKAFPIPSLVASCPDLLPCGQRKAGNIGFARLDSMPMYGRVGADHFDLRIRLIKRLCHAAPSLAGDVDRIDRIGNHVEPETQILPRYRITHVVALGSFDADAGLPQACSTTSTRR